MNLNALSLGNDVPNDINVVVEVPVGSKVKYELDKESGALCVDRFLFTPMAYPGNYGFIPRTLSEDGDPADVLICNSEPLVPCSVINVRPIGVLIMEDDGGKDEKIIAVPTAKLSGLFSKIQEYTDLPDILLKQIEHFFMHYKDLEPGKWAKIHGWKDKAQAQKLIQEALDRAI